MIVDSVNRLLPRKLDLYFPIQNADFVVAALSIQARRREVMDFSFPYYEEPSPVLYKKPKSGSRVSDLLLSKENYSHSIEILQVQYP